MDPEDAAGKFIADPPMLPELTAAEAALAEKILDIAGRPQAEFITLTAQVHSLHNEVVETVLGLRYLQKIRRKWLDSGVKPKGHLTSKAERLIEILTALGPVLDAMEAIDESDGLVESDKSLNLCVSCAISSTCQKKGPDVVQCHDWHEYIKALCPNCIYWDVDNCALSVPCQGGDEHVPVPETGSPVVV